MKVKNNGKVFFCELTKLQSNASAYLIFHYILKMHKASIMRYVRLV